MMQLGTVLTIDDEFLIRKLIKHTLEEEQIHVIEADSGTSAIDILKKTHVDLILLDILLGDYNGLDLLTEFHKLDIACPIIILSTKGTETDQIIGLGIGGDDYITKPFKPSILSAKVKAHLRRSKKTRSTLNDSKKIIAEPFTFDLNSFQLYKNGQEIHLTSKETLLMKVFLENKNIVLSKSQLYEHVWQNTFIDDNSIMVYIRHLREKIEDTPQKPVYLKTIRGIGYKFSTD